MGRGVVLAEGNSTFVVLVGECSVGAHCGQLEDTCEHVYVMVCVVQLAF